MNPFTTNQYYKHSWINTAAAILFVSQTMYQFTDFQRIHYKNYLFIVTAAKIIAM